VTGDRRGIKTAIFDSLVPFLDHNNEKNTPKYDLETLQFGLTSTNSLSGERIWRTERDWQFVLRHDNHVVFGDREATIAVEFGIVAENSIRRQLYVLVDDRTSNASIPPYIDAIEQDRIFDHSLGTVRN